MNKEEYLAYLSYINNGKWHQIYNDLKSQITCQKTKYADFCSDQAIKNKSYITIFDSDYPLYCNNVWNPPFVLYYYGNKQLLKHKIIMITGNISISNIIEVKDSIENFSKEYVFCNEAWKGLDIQLIDYLISKNKNIIINLACGIEYAKNSLPKKWFDYSNLLFISEYPSNYHTSKITLKARNRISAAISNYLVLLSCYKSTMNNLIDQFLNIGKEVYCLDDTQNNLNEDNFNKNLINEGAGKITSITDLILK
ncbi:DNA-processing protein DprA [Metamycoplasma hominis]|uniref:DNA-processing protein DprA n=1 Tax=Metamycoplasma hominis TaxID=2098 RepID=UPI0034D97125